MQISRQEFCLQRMAAVAILLAALAISALVLASRAEAEDEFVGNIPTSGVGLGIWSGGDVTHVASSVAGAGCTLQSVWTASSGQFLPFIPGAPAVANAAFLAAFGGPLIPANTALIIVCAAEAGPEPPPSPPSTTVTFGDGTHAVGSEIPPGRYRAKGIGPTCYWARLSGFGGTLEEILANDLAFGTATEVADIAPGDAGFQTSGCGTWSSDLSPVTSSPTAAFGDGTYIVGVDISPGTWRAPGGDRCYWARLAGFNGAVDDIISNDLPAGAAVVTIAPTDKGFKTSNCGDWSPA
jgi:hypothetical protein